MLDSSLRSQLVFGSDLETFVEALHGVIHTLVAFLKFVLNWVHLSILSKIKVTRIIQCHGLVSLSMSKASLC